jgi:poly(A) polymerase
VRIANKMGFKIEPKSAEPIPRLAHLLQEIPAARLFDEVLKVLLGKEALINFRHLRETGLFQQLFPLTEARLHDAQALDFVTYALENTVDRLQRELTVSPGFLYAALLWPPVRMRARELEQRQGHHPNVAINQASEEVLAKAVQLIAIPKRFSIPMREIWQLQSRFDIRTGARAKRLLTHPRFRAAYDFMLLRARAGEISMEVGEWWTQAQVGVELPAAPRYEADAGDGDGEARTAAPRKRRRRGGRNRGGPKAPPAQ